jgi:NAD(P)-dependent dehydrogenase (short-subunit alcohol dehydrogenase family)
MAREGITREEARARRRATIPAGRYGTAEEFGAMCAFLCSEQAGYIVGAEHRAGRGFDQPDAVRVARVAG